MQALGRCSASSSCPLNQHPQQTRWSSGTKLDSRLYDLSRPSRSANWHLVDPASSNPWLSLERNPSHAKPNPTSLSAIPRMLLRPTCRANSALRTQCGLPGPKPVLSADGAVVQVRHGHGRRAGGTRRIDLDLVLGHHLNTPLLPVGGLCFLRVHYVLFLASKGSPKESNPFLGSRERKKTTPTHPFEDLAPIPNGGLDSAPCFCVSKLPLCADGLRVLADRPVASHREGHVASHPPLP